MKPFVKTAGDLIWKFIFAIFNHGNSNLVISLFLHHEMMKDKTMLILPEHTL